MRFFWLWFAAAAPVLAQGLHFGVKAGVPLGTYFETRRIGILHGYSDYSAATRRYTAGVTAEWRLKRTFGLEADVLYKRMGYVGIIYTAWGGNITTSAFDAKGHSWEFPLLAKYRLGRVVRPFVAGGGVLRYVGPIRARGQVTVENLVARTTTITPIDTTEPSDFRKRIYPGLTVAGGIEFERGRARLLPEFRYTRWTANIQSPGGVLRFNPDQAEFLLGLLF